MSTSTYTRISYFDLLPLIYQRDVEGGDNEFLRNFLKAFEDGLFGQGEEDSILSAKGPVEILQYIHAYYDPDTTPRDFVEWLSGWVALDLSREVENFEKQEESGSTPEETLQHFPFQEIQRGRKRHLIKKLAPLYHLRGTKEGLRQIIDIYFGDDLRGFHINELIKPFVIGDAEGLKKVQSDYLKRKGLKEEDVDFKKISINDLLARENYDALGSVVGRSTVVGEAPPYYFIVVAETLLPVSRIVGANMKREMAFIIDLEKPAHTYYTQKLRAPGMRVGVRDWCDVGVSTLIKGFEI